MATLSYEAKLKLDQLLETSVSQSRAPAIVFAAATPEKELYIKYVGKQAIDAPSAEDVSKDSVFWVCSMAKLVVTIAALQLVEQGKIKLYTPVGDIIPELKDPVIIENPQADVPTYRTATNPILLYQLLNHTSGLAYTLEKRGANYLTSQYTDEAYGGGDVTEERFLELLKGDHPAIPVLFEPGTDWMYGFSSDILAIVVQRIAGVDIESYCQQHIFGPLGMKSVFRLTPEAKNNLVKLAFRKEDGSVEPYNGQLPILQQDPEKVKFCFGGIGLYSTIDDYLVFLRHLLSIHVGDVKSGIVSAPTVHSLFRPDVPEKGEPIIKWVTGWSSAQFGYGLALNLEDWEGMRRSGSGFWWGWAGTYFLMDPTMGVAVVLGTQLIPRGDPEVLKLWKELEQALYSGLTAA